MEITGYDNVIFTCVDPRTSLREALSSLRNRWGTLKLTVESPEGVKKSSRLRLKS